MTAEPRQARGLQALLRRLRWIHLAPVLAFVALSAWGFASPVGAAPDDDYHLVSIWCADGGGAQCEPGTSDRTRSMSKAFGEITCYAEHAKESAACQTSIWNKPGRFVTDRGNFTGEYPPVYYAVMHIFAGSDIQVSALLIREINAFLFVALSTALGALLPRSRRSSLFWGWLIASVPLGMFIIASDNPSTWAITGIGTDFLALRGWFETAGRRRWALGALYLLGMLMASGARGDAAVYAIGATVTAGILSAERTRDWALRAILPLIAIAIAVVFFATATQAGVATGGFTGGSAADAAAGGGPVHPTGWALAAYNLLMLPYLWTGVWGTWALGWFDTTLPAVVPWAAAAAFIAVAFAGLGKLSWRKAISLAGVLLVLIVLPVYVLTVGGEQVGNSLQPRYLLPLILLFSLLLTTMPPGAALRFTRLQTFVIVAALAGANLVALQVNIRRYITGVVQQGIDLDAGAQWWWPGFPVGPIWVWIIGSLAFAGLLVVLWPQLRWPVPEPLLPVRQSFAGAKAGAEVVR
ncbi:MAG: DUF2142 domain-containing protein [Pseudolysinimonas sp.]